MFRPASTEPAPSPRGTANRQSQPTWGAKENPSRAKAVMATLTSVTRPVPNRRMTRVLIRLEITVPQETIIEMTPAKGRGTSRLFWMAGQAEPNRESGRPKLIKDT